MRADDTVKHHQGQIILARMLGQFIHTHVHIHTRIYMLRYKRVKGRHYPIAKFSYGSDLGGDR